MLVPSLYRAGALVGSEELANVAGRAGRAFVDVEGLIAHVVFDKPEWRLRQWRQLVTSIRARTLKSGLIQVVAEIIRRLALEGVLDRDDAAEYLANARDAWRSSAEVARENTAGRGSDGLDEGDSGDEKAIGEEEVSQLVEKLDAMVFGLVEALDADSVDLPRALDTALRGSLWERQLAREDEGTRSDHRLILEARAKLIWTNTSAGIRKGHFAMGVGLEAGLAIDAIAPQLEALLDRADAAALPGHQDELADALGELGEKLFAIRPFVPDKRNRLPRAWRTLLKQWVSGLDVQIIGPENMGVVEDAFCYRLVWALEALRMRRLSRGWSPELIAGTGAAVLETGVPQFRMSMLIRAGLPSRRAAIAAVRLGSAEFINHSEMRAWLIGGEVGRLTDRGDWPTAETAALWRRFRDEALSGEIELWGITTWERSLNLAAGADTPRAGLYRIEVDNSDQRTWLATPDFRRVASFRTSVSAPQPSLYWALLTKGAKAANVRRVGCGDAVWPRSESK